MLPDESIIKAEIFRQLDYQPHPGQRVFHDSQARFKVLIAGSRFGKSLAAARDVLALLKTPNTRGWIVAPSYRLGEKELRYIAEDVKRLDWPIKKVRYGGDHGPSTLITEWGSELLVLSAAQPWNLLGDEVDWMILSEAAQLGEDIWTRFLRARLANRKGRLIIPTTPSGYNWVHALYLRGLDPAFPEWESFHYRTEDNPLIPREEIEDAKRTLPADIFEEQFGGAFVTRSGLVYPEFEPTMHVMGRNQPETGTEKDAASCALAGRNEERPEPDAVRHSRPSRASGSNDGSGNPVPDEEKLDSCSSRNDAATSRDATKNGDTARHSPSPFQGEGRGEGSYPSKTPSPGRVAPTLSLGEGEGTESTRNVEHSPVRFHLTGEWEHYGCADFGHTSPFVLLKAAVNHGRIVVYDEYYASHRTLPAHLDAVEKKIGGLRDLRAIIADPSGAQWQGELRDQGFNVIAAPNDVLYGIDLVRRKLIIGNDNGVGLMIHPRCTNLIREFTSYRYAEEPGADGERHPLKQSDHALDALRYLCLWLARKVTWIQVPARASAYG